MFQPSQFSVPSGRRLTAYGRLRGLSPALEGRRSRKGALARAVAAPIEQLERRELLTVSFAPPVDYVTGNQPTGVFLADLNSDGNPDLVSTNSPDNTVSVLLNAGDGTFGAKKDFAAGNHPVDVAIADYNGDGLPDLAVADLASGNVSILLNIGGGSFGAAKSYLIGGQPTALTAADFNGDGKIDLAVTLAGVNTVKLLINNGLGGFVAGNSYVVGGIPSNVTVGDFRGIGSKDLAVTSSNNTVSILLGDGDGTFTTGTALNVGSNPTSIVAGDFNGDGASDLAVANSGGNTVSLLLSNGDGTFAPAVNYPVGPHPSSLAAADIDGDGMADIAVADGSGVTVLLNNGDGTFTPNAASSADPGSPSLAGADLNSDGRTDLVLANPTATGIATVLISNRSAPGVTINQAVGQVDPTQTSPINFTVVFDTPVTGFTGAGVGLSGSAGATTAVVTSIDAMTYNVAVSGMARSGLVIASILPNAAKDANNNGNLPSVSTDNQVTFQYLAPLVSIEQAVSQGDPTKQSPINFTVTFSKPVTGFTGSGVQLSGTAGATTAVVTGTGTTYNVAVSGMTQAGTVIATIPAGVATAVTGGFANLASTSFDNVVTFDNVPPTVTINQAASQADPTDGSVITFTVVFNKPVFGFAPAAVALGGTAGATTVNVSGSGTTYTVVITGMVRPGTVIATVLAGVVTDAAGNRNLASTSTDNTVTMRTFTPRFDYAVGVAPQGMISADFNGDGKPDLALANTGDNTVSVLLNQGGGAFTAHAPYLTGSGPVAVAAADFNGDGKPDLAVVNGVDDTVSVLLNKGDGNLLAKTDYAVGSYPAAVVAADFNGDGYADLAVINSNGDTLSILMNNGDGTFAPAVDYAAGILPTSVAAADFNGDGRIDLVISGRDAVTGKGGFIVMTNVGNGVFANIGSYYFDTAPESIVAADFNGDGRPDIALCDNSSNTLSVLLNDGKGAFIGRTDYVTDSNPVSVSALDFNGDGRLDLAVACSSSNTVGVFLNTGGGAFSTEIQYAVGNSPRTLATADFNGDRKGDLAVTNSADNKVTVLLNNRAVPTASIAPTDKTNPTPASTVNFTVVFSEAVAGFTYTDVVLSGSAGATTAVVTGGPAIYNVAVSGMQRNGAVTISIPANAANTVADGYGNAAATGPAGTITYNQLPTVTINRAVNEPNPTNAATVDFTVVFNKPVYGFTAAGVVLGGTAGATKAVITALDAMTYNVAVTGMTQPGTITATIAPGAAVDSFGNPCVGSTSTNNIFLYNNIAPLVTINRLAERPNPTNQTPINFTVVFSKPVTGFTSAGVMLGGTSGPTTAVVTGSGSVYNVAVSGMTQPGTVIVTIPAGAATDSGGNPNLASTSTDNIVNFDNQPVIASVAGASASFTRISPINFTVIFNKPVAGFGNGSVMLSGTAGATTAIVSGGGETYNVVVSGMTGPGTVVVTIPAGMVTDAAGNFNLAAAGTVTFDNTAPTVVVSRASGQAASSNANTINFAVLFSRPVVGFGAGAVLFAGSAGASGITVTGSGAAYNVAVTGMQQSGTVSVTVPAGVVTDQAGNPNAASTGSDNTVIFDNNSPNGVLHAVNITAASKNAYKFSVTYTDNVAVKAATIGDGNILVTGPRGYRAGAKWVKPARPLNNGNSVTGSYSIIAPGGTWDQADNGLYTVILLYRQISDMAGNSIAASRSGLALGTFRVGIGTRAAVKTAALFSTTPVAAPQRVATTLFAVSAKKPNDILG